MKLLVYAVLNKTELKSGLKVSVLFHIGDLMRRGLYFSFFFLNKCGAFDLSNHLGGIPAVPVVAVQSRQFLHVGIADGEVKNPSVASYSVWIR